VLEGAERRLTDLSNLETADAYRPSNLSSDEVLIALARALTAITWTQGKGIWFLLDDYSVTVLPAFVQSSYNPVVFRLSDELRIRVSSEGDGPHLSDRLGRRYKEGRELSKVSLGEVYFAAAESKGQEFFEEILDARFNEVGKGSLESLKLLLGQHEKLDGFGDYICSQKRPSDARFSGFDLVCRLCSG
jgi:hypothetical protein